MTFVSTLLKRNVAFSQHKWAKAWAIPCCCSEWEHPSVPLHQERHVAFPLQGIQRWQWGEMLYRVCSQEGDPESVLTLVKILILFWFGFVVEREQSVFCQENLQQQKKVFSYCCLSGLQSVCSRDYIWWMVQSWLFFWCYDECFLLTLRHTEFWMCPAEDVIRNCGMCMKQRNYEDPPALAEALPKCLFHTSPPPLHASEELWESKMSRMCW